MTDQRVKIQLGLLLLLGVITAVFMIGEAGSFYSTLYGDTYFSWFGFVVAFLIEAFLALMPLAVFENIGNSKVKTRIWNGIRGFLLVTLFTVAVGGASLRIVRPKLLDLSTSSKSVEMVELIAGQQEVIKEAIDTFKDQNQKTNTAIAFKEFITTAETLRDSLADKEEDSVGNWIDISLTIAIRFVLQLSNLVCFWMIGYHVRSHSVEGIRSDIFHIAMKSNKTLDQLCEAINCTKETFIKALYHGYKIKNIEQMIRFRSRLRDIGK